MANGQPMQRAHRNFAASAAFLLLATWYALPAMASNEVAASLTDKTEAFAERESKSQTQFLPPRFLAPRAEAAIRKAFAVAQGVPDASRDSKSPQAAAVPPLAEADSSADATGADDSRDFSSPGMNTRLPGVSEKDLLLYKKQMYRRDI